LRSRNGWISLIFAHSLCPTNGPSRVAASATRCSVLLACLPPASRSSTWRRSRHVPPTQHHASCHPPLAPLALRQSRHRRPQTLTPTIAASATRCSVLLACLPPAARSSTWRRSRHVPPTQHPASCHPPLTPLALRQSHLLWRPLIVACAALLAAFLWVSAVVATSRSFLCPTARPSRTVCVAPRPERW
jgi:hypothetical protein